MSLERDPWSQQLPTLFRALADPEVEMPPPRNDSLVTASASWGALHYALHCLLGWDDVGRGMAWWYNAGRPVHDSPVLALVERVWGQDELIDFYAAWAWRLKTVGWLQPQAQDATDVASTSWLASHSGWPDEDWWRNFARRGQVQPNDPYYGGTDPLHLAAHTGREDNCPSPDAAHPLVTAEGRAILLTGGNSHWLSDLELAESKLPPRGERSWRVDVFDRRVGWLGEFRRSRVSGRWFTGKHYVHKEGMEQ